MRLTIVDVARICHEANRAYCVALGDMSQPTWEEASDWQKQSAWNGVNFALETPHATPAMQHESWMKEKELDGWTYGPVKNVIRKTHPCFLPYEDLPAEQRAKDYLFLSIVDTFRQCVVYPEMEMSYV